jgi:ADP-ribose pyrophosphatase YjhB (NUDIX family)
MLMKLTGIVWKLSPPRFRTFVARRLQTTFTVSAAGIITNAEGKVLLLNHVLRPASGWGVPGGFMSAGEQPDVTLKREIKEETGIDLVDIHLYRVRTRGIHIEIVLTARGVGEPAVKSREIIELGWFAVDAMPPEMPREQWRLIEEALLKMPKA